MRHVRDRLGTEVQKGAVLDRFDTSLKSQKNSLFTMCVGSHRTAKLSRFLHQGMNFIFIKMSGTRYAILHQHRACDANLDQVGSVFHLFPDCFADLIDAIRHAVHAFVIIGAGLGDRDEFVPPGTCADRQIRPAGSNCALRTRAHSSRPGRARS